MQPQQPDQPQQPQDQQPQPQAGFPQPGQFQQPVAQPYQQAQQPQYAAPGQVAGEDPGKTLGIIGLVIGIVILPLAGLIICIIANNKSKQAGYKNTIAKAGIWVSAGLMVLGLIVIIIAVIAGAASSGSSSSSY